jgi:transcriptional regulator with XRE-family HTH domain
MDIRKHFGAKVREFRIVLGLSQEAVAARMGVDRAYISQVERGGQNVTLLSLLEIAQALEVRPADLLAEANPPAGSAQPRPAEPGGA